MCELCGSNSRLWYERHGAEGSVVDGPAGSGSGAVAKPSKTVDEAVTQLLRDNAQPIPAAAPKTITYAYRATGPAANDANKFGDLTTFQQLTATQITFMEGAFDRWEEVANITFQRQFGAGGGAYSDTGTLLVGNYTKAFTNSGGFAGSGGIWLNNDQDAGTSNGQTANITGFSNVTSPTLGSTVYEVLYLHEVGHWVGLAHPSNYDSSGGVTINYETSASYREDSRLYSIMSYWGANEVGAVWSVASGTPMIHDIAAAHRLYGANTTTRTGDTIYGFNSNTGINTFLIANASVDRTFTIWDAGGFDTIDMSGYADSQTIKLTAGAYSSTGGQTFNLGIAVGAVIEAAIGGSNTDVMLGNEAGNRLEGRNGGDSIYGYGGGDALYGGAGADVIEGGSGNDTLYGESEDDRLFGGTDTDTLYGGANNDILDGEAGNDTLYGESGADRLFGGADADTLYGGNENDELFGGSGGDTLDGGLSSDTLRGESGFDLLRGGDGDDFLYGDGDGDTLDGGAGADLLNGGDGIDKVDYTAAAGALDIDLVTGNGKTMIGAGFVLDTLVSIEDLDGSAFGDKIAGNNVANSIGGFGGNDTIYGLAGDDVMSGNLGDDWLDGGLGSDFLYGDEGIDTVSYASETLGISLDMAGAPTAGKATTSNGAYTDTIIDVEIVIGSDFGDTLKGNANANTFYGRTGRDTIEGLNGDDRLFGEGADDTIRGGEGLDTLDGGTGSDLLDGGNGNDTASYATAIGVVEADLNTGKGKVTESPGYQTDTLVSIENLVGSAFNDRLIGDGVANRLDGGAGDDYMAGGAGIDSLYGDSGIDTAGFAGETAGVSVYLNTSKVTTSAGQETLVDFENVEGSNFADTISGTLTDNVIQGLGGIDRIEGGAGIDTASYAEKTLAVSVNLIGTAPVTVFVGGVAEDTLSGIENIIGGAGADSLTGNEFANALSGGDGEDYIRGMGGADVIDGGSGRDLAVYDDKTVSIVVKLNGATNAQVLVDGVVEDTLRNIEGIYGGSGADRLTGDGSNNTFDGGGGDDILIGGGGQDSLNGNGGLDTADYSDKTASVEVVFEIDDVTYVYVGGVQEDTLNAIENVTGGSGNDRLGGDGFANVLKGGAGNDTLAGNGGLDTLEGGQGVDTADFSRFSAAVTVALAGAAASSVLIGGLAQGTLRSIENLIGGQAGDSLTGDAYANWFQGRLGDDLLDGGLGLDTADYGDKTLAIAVTLAGAAEAIVTVDGVVEDRLRNIENVTGGAGEDLIRGDALANVLRGGLGNDYLSGGLGLDLLDGGAGVDLADFSEQRVAVVVTLNGATAVRATVGGLADDTLQNIENVAGGRADDVLGGDGAANGLFGNSGDDVFIGRGGADLINGGAGVDTASFSDKTEAVSVTLRGSQAALVTVGAVTEDTLIMIENVIGGSGADTLIGDGFANALTGGSGDDLLAGRGGADLLTGGFGVDTADYSEKTVAISVTLSGATLATVTVGGVAEDSIVGIENVIGGVRGDTLTGDALANRFDGRGGSDILTGGGGRDVFVFSTAPSAGNMDRITDFDSLDTFELSRDVFSALPVGRIAPTAFKNLATGRLDADDRILYDSATGAVSYDADGSGAGAGIVFAMIDNRPALNYGDFFVV